MELLACVLTKYLHRRPASLAPCNIAAAAAGGTLASRCPAFVLCCSVRSSLDKSATRCPSVEGKTIEKPSRDVPWANM
jgi:hypothetical protein